MQESVVFLKKNLKKKYLKDKNNVKLEIIVIIQGGIEFLHIVYVI